MSMGRVPPPTAGNTSSVAAVLRLASSPSRSSRQVVHLGPRDRRRQCAVDMNAEKQVRLAVIGDGIPLVQGDRAVVVSCHHHPDAEPCFHQRFQPPRDVERDLPFRPSLRRREPPDRRRRGRDRSPSSAAVAPPAAEGEEHRLAEKRSWAAEQANGGTGAAVRSPETAARAGLRATHACCRSWLSSTTRGMPARGLKAIATVVL